MTRSLGLTAYRALARRGEVPKTAQEEPRPQDELVWIHAAEPESLLAVLDLAARLCTTRSGLAVLITQVDPWPEPPQPANRDHHIVLSVAPAEHPESVAAFLDHWRPDACVWTWGALRPNLVLETASRGCHMILIDADTKGFDGRRDRWLGDLTRSLLAQFSHILARSEAGRRRLLNIGVASHAVEVTSALMAGGQALPCADSDLSGFSEALGGRPAWFAVRTQPGEISTVLSAHRQALRLSHRLLLILNPAEETQAEDVVQTAIDKGFNVVHWDGDRQPDDTTQIMVVDDVADRGLFYRLAPVSFLGSSLVPGEGGCDPFEAAALGSAVLYGPKVRRFLPSYSRLAAAGAARIVNDAAALGTAVSRLIAPDQAATMAHAGWDVISQGAELTDKVTDLVQDALDAKVRRS